MQIEKENSEELESHPKHKKKKQQINKGLMIGVGILIFVVGLTVFVYRSAPTSFFVRVTTSVIPYPAVYVDGTFVSISAYLSEYDALVNYFETSGEEGVEVPSEEKMREMILETITNKIVIKKLAKKYHVKKDQDRIEEFYQDIVSGEESEEVFKDQIKSTFGWSLKEFKKRIVESIVLAMQMGEFIFENEDIQKTQKDLVEKSHERIVAGEDFGAVANEVHLKVQVAIESDLGFLKLSQIPESWKGSVADLKVGEYTDVIELDEGYAMFTVVDRIIAGEDTQIHLMTLTVPKKSLEKVVDEYLQDATIKRYLK